MEQERITGLEITLAYQEDMIKQLNQVIFAQQKQIDELKHAVTKLNGRIGEIENSSGGADSEKPEIPPHY